MANTCFGRVPCHTFAALMLAVVNAGCQEEPLEYPLATIQRTEIQEVMARISPQIDQELTPGDEWFAVPERYHGSLLRLFRSADRDPYRSLVETRPLAELRWVLTTEEEVTVTVRNAGVLPLLFNHNGTLLMRTGTYNLYEDDYHFDESSLLWVFLNRVRSDPPEGPPSGRSRKPWDQLLFSAGLKDYSNPSHTDDR